MATATGQVRYKVFGRTGLRVSELAFGAGSFGAGWGWGADRPTSRALLEAFGAAGGNLIDCADIYQNGESEQILGELIAGERDRWIVTTTYSGAAPGPIARNGNNRKRQLHREI